MTKLARVLGLRDLTLLTIGSVIGSGIFLVPGEVLKQAGGQIGPAMLVWFAGGVLSLLGALTYAELSAENPKAGGIYVHLRECFGPLPAFLFGWTLFFAMNGGTVATLAVAFSTMLSAIVPLSPANDKGGVDRNDCGADGSEYQGHPNERRFAELDNRDKGRRDTGDVRCAAGIGTRLLGFERGGLAERIQRIARFGIWACDDRRAVGLRRMAIPDVQRG